MKKILVVDDDEGILDALEALLDSNGYNVAVSSDGEKLLKLDKKDLPDLILLDVLLSGKDGRDLCKILKKQEHTRKIPVIMLSAHPSVNQTITQCGADAFVAKPFEMDELLRQIEKFLN